jgi:hypothetical protein
MRFHSADYRKDRDLGRGNLLNRGFWFYLPRPLATCGLLGHKPVVDGTEGFNGRTGHRWVCCDRCGIRPEPQGALDPAVWNVGDQIDLAVRGGVASGIQRRPGPWPSRPEGTIGGQLIIGGHVTAGVSVKVGNAGSEHVLAARACVPYLGGLYLHTERFGQWLQRRLNPVGYESKVISVDVHNGQMWWQVWANPDEHHRDTPRWRDGSARLDPRDIAWGEKRYTYEGHAAGPRIVPVTMPDGDSYDVTMTLQRQSFGRPGRRQRLSWTVKCSHREGIPYRHHDWKDGLCGWSVPVSDEAAQRGTWQREAAAASAAKVAGMRIRYGWKPPVAAA